MHRIIRQRLGNIFDTYAFFVQGDTTAQDVKNYFSKSNMEFLFPDLDFDAEQLQEDCDYVLLYLPELVAEYNELVETK